MTKFKRNIFNTIFQGINNFSVANELKHERQTAIGKKQPVDGAIANKSLCLVYCRN